ncbi:MAG: hypothetical protein Q9160_004206 [Pyrenula sp. 1 TL-2023]
MTDSLGPAVLVTAFTLVGVSTVIVALRFFCRFVKSTTLQLSDHLILSALLTTWGIAVINFYQVKYGTGRHMNDQPSKYHPELAKSYLVGTLKSWYIYQFIYLLDLLLVKCSILAFYWMIISRRGYRLAIYIVGGIVGVFTVTMIFVNAFECRKPSDAWTMAILDQSSNKSKCWHLQNVYYAQAAFNIASDIVILLLPMPVFLTLKMRQKKRVALVAIFSCGGVAVVASGIRIYALYQYSTLTDASFFGAAILICSQVELNVGIITASVPSLKPLFKNAFSGTLTRGKYNYAEDRYQYGSGYGNGSRGGKSALMDNKSGTSVAMRSLGPRSTDIMSTTRPGTAMGMGHGNQSDEQLFLYTAGATGGTTHIRGGPDNPPVEDDKSGRVTSETSWIGEDSESAKSGHEGNRGRRSEWPLSSPPNNGIMKSVNIETHSVRNEVTRPTFARTRS